MIVKRGDGDFSRVYRPCRMSEVSGQEKIKLTIKAMLDSGNVFHSFLFHGESGTGKTTIARIIAMSLLCRKGIASEPCGECESCKNIIANRGDIGFFDLNAANFNLIDNIRDLKNKHFYAPPYNSDRQIFFFDECQRLTIPAQEALLPEIEMSPKHNYFIFSTTETKNLLPTLMNRCSQHKFKLLDRVEIRKLLLDVCGIEGVRPDEKIFDGIIAGAEGRARNALILLQEKIVVGILRPKNEGRIEHLQGENRILVVAPHAAPGDINDDNTGIIARSIQSALSCFAVINEKYSRDEVDLNEISTIQTKPEIESEFLHPIREFKNEIKAKKLQPLVVYLHGILNENIRDAVGPDKHILIGYGQGGKKGKKEYPNLPTFSVQDLKMLQDALNSVGIRSVPAPINSGYCARDEENLNQLFNLKKHKDYCDPDVRSFQLEIKAEGLRTNETQALNTGDLLAKALKNLAEMNVESQPAKYKPELELVNRSLAFLKEAFKKGIYAAKLEAGQHIIHSVLKDDYELARNLKKAKKSNATLKELINRLKGQDGNSPSKTWVYDAVKLAVDEKVFRGFRTYGMLGLSHKVRLTHISDPETKKQLIQQAIDKQWTVADLRSEIAKEKEKARKEKARKPAKVEKGYGFQEWAGKRINICTGCENDCIYCWAKEGAYRRKQVLPGKWTQPIIRQKDVDQPRRFYKTRVAFPSTHDILPTNIDPYLVVLGKLLRAGNEVLIVSKPRPDCIKRICEATQFFKDKILFRFTIGAMDDKVLSFWEPNAPEYKERKECLEYAFKHGFRTSVSMEPMLDTSRIDALIKDVDPFVNEDIWLGTMNHLGFVKQSSKKGLTEQLALIEAGQTPERLLAIYRKYQNNPKIKWKSDPWKLIEQAIEAEKMATEKKVAQIKMAEQGTETMDRPSSGEKVPGLDKIEIEKSDGTKVEATAPSIVSAKVVKGNFERIDQTSEMLLPPTDPSDVISIETTKRKPGRPKKAVQAKSAGRKKVARG